MKIANPPRRLTYRAMHGMQGMHAAGFTLLEMIISIVLTGILAGAAMVFISGPVKGYLDTSRRAELSDTADLILRRLAREVHRALPNSLRVTSNLTIGGFAYDLIEFIPTTGGGQYRDALDGGSTSLGIPLTFNDSGACADNLCKFDVVAPADLVGLVPTINVKDYIVVNNRGNDSFAVPGNAYASGDPCTGTVSTTGSTGCNRARVTDVTGNTVTLSANVFGTQSPPLPSPYNRFQVVPGTGTSINVVTFGCRHLAASPGGFFYRYTGYAFPGNTQAVPSSVTPATLARNASCNVSYTTGFATTRNGLLTVTLTLYDTQGTDSVTLVRQIHVDNSP